MTIFFSNIKRILKKRSNRILLFVIPIVFVLLSSIANISNSKINVAVADGDNTQFSKAFIKGLKEKCYVVVMSQDRIKDEMISSPQNYGIIIKKGFTESIINGEDSKLETFRPDSTNTAFSVKLYLDNYINAAKNIAKSANGNKEQFYSGLKEYENGPLKSEVRFAESSGENKSNEKLALGLLGYAMLLIATYSTNILLEDKKNGTFIRMFASPLKNWQYTLQNIMSFLFILLIQVFIAFELLFSINKIKVGTEEINLILIYAVYAAACVALGLVVNSLSKNIDQATGLSVLLNTVIAMLGGFFWQKEYMPDFLITLSKFTPAYWLIDARDKLLASASLFSVAQDVGIIMLFTAVFFMIASRGKVYIENM